MNFLVDAHFRRGFAAGSRHGVIEAVHVTERDGALTDEAIAIWAEVQGLILVSKDEDFQTIRLPNRFSVLWLRCGNSTNRALAEWLDARWATVEKLLASGERLIELI